MAAAHKHARRGAVSSEGSEAPKRKVRESPRAVSAEPAVQVAPSKPDVVEPILPKVEAITIPPPMANPVPVLGLAKEKPVSESPAPIVKLVHPPVAAANSAPEYLKDLARERAVWGVVVAVSWTVTVVALLRLAGIV